MSIIDNIVTVNISSSALPLTTEAFDTILILDDNKNEVSVKTYSSLVSLSDDYATNTKVYKIANTIFSQNRRPTKIMVGQCETDKFDEGYTALKTINNDFYAVILSSKTIATQLAIADLVEADTKIFGCSSNAADILHDTDGLNGKLRDKNYKRTFSVLASKADEYPEAGILGLALTYPAGSITWNLKELSGVTSKIIDNASDYKSKYCNYVQRLAGRNVFMDGVAINGTYLDIIHGEDKLKNNIQVYLVNALLANGKIPYTQQGLDIIEGAIRNAALSSASDGFLDKDSIIVRIPGIADISSQDKSERVLKNVYLECKYAGAIHKINIEVVINL